MRFGRTARCAEGLFCTAVPMTHSACTFTSSEGELSKPCSGSHIPSFSRSENHVSDALTHTSCSTTRHLRCRCSRRAKLQINEWGTRLFRHSHHLEIVERGQACVLVERRILRLGEGLLHEYRVRPAQYRVDDPGIQVCHLPSRRTRSSRAVRIRRVFDTPA
jgi:hypothetical protein